MPSELEVRRGDKDRLFDLLELEMLNKQQGIKVIGLDRLITKTMAIMPQDDVKVVKQMLAEQLGQ